MKIIHRITPNPELMTEWADKSATLYLAATIYYWIEKTIGHTSNMRKKGKHLQSEAHSTEMVYKQVYLQRRHHHTKEEV